MTRTRGYVTFGLYVGWGMSTTAMGAREAR